MRTVTGLAEDDEALVRAFLQGAASVGQEAQPFAARDLVGGANVNWNGTLLQVLYDKHVKAGKTADQAFKGAAVDLGLLLKSVLDRDARFFAMDTSGYANTYIWRPEVA